MEKLKNITLLLVVMMIFGIIIWYIAGQNQQLGAVSNGLDTSSNNIAHATTSLVITPTQMWSSLTKVGQIINTTANQVTCSMDATGTTAASSTLVAGNGVIIAGSTAGNISSVATFGECYPGAVNCYAHKGALNCLAAATSTVTYWKK